jgi:hypothetical protein
METQQVHNEQITTPSLLNLKTEFVASLVLATFFTKLPVQHRFSWSVKADFLGCFAYNGSVFATKNDVEPCLTRL